MTLVLNRKIFLKRRRILDDTRQALIGQNK